MIKFGKYYLNYGNSEVHTCVFVFNDFPKGTL